MSSDAGLLPAILLSSLVPAVVIFLLPEDRRRLRTTINLTGASLKLVLIGVVMWGSSFTPARTT